MDFILLPDASIVPVHAIACIGDAARRPRAEKMIEARHGLYESTREKMALPPPSICVMTHSKVVLPLKPKTVCILITVFTMGRVGEVSSTLVPNVGPVIAVSKHCERGGEEDFLRSHGFLLASSLLGDAADWFAVPPPPPSPLDRVVFNSSSKLSANDMAALNGDEDEDAAE
ncbi:unnamed protein product [Hydatigera taeniaeformis]|uniref:Uncharacterized protein n=1 Tax=Hydatigena taeniaeformis TaxID=6205 RepID=A0A0R3WQA7_HYDTA|nr:unnamed protein product [Hydatigera taeniaeformis]